jgi:hypothetical protein
MVSRSAAQFLVGSRRFLKKIFEATFSILDGPLPLAKRPFIFFFLSPVREPMACRTRPPTLYSAPSALSCSLLLPRTSPS